MTRIRIGTRGSRLALAQSHAIADELRALHPGLEIDVTIIQTQGDHVLDAPLSQIGGKGVFTREIELALLDKRIDLAVHSLKDLPTKNPDGLSVGAITKRESPRDVLVTPRDRDTGSLGPGDVIGTSSLRRSAQLRACFPGLETCELRGNVPTRLRKMTDQGLAGIVLAEAGIRRLGLAPEWMRVLDDDIMIPAPGQGALGLQIRADDETLARLLAPLNDAPTAARCTAERTLLDRLGGGCQVPLGAIADILDDGRLRLRGRVMALDGATVIECEVYGSPDDPVTLGAEAAEKLRSNGAIELIENALHAVSTTDDEEPEPDKPISEIRVAVTRDEDADGPLSRELRQRGMVPVCVPLIRARTASDLGALEQACARGFDWIVISSANTIDALRSASESVHAALRSARIACVGSGTAAALQRELGIEAALVGEQGRDELLERITPMIDANARVLVPQGNLAPMLMANGLRALGCDVTVVVVYETTHLEKNATVLRSLLERGECQAITFCSSSAVDAFASTIANASGLLAASNMRVASIGQSTTDTAAELGLAVDLQPATPSFATLAQALREALGAAS